MDQEKFNLMWHSFTDHLSEMLHNMMTSNELTDVTLVSEDMKKFKAHKIVLGACSPVFKSFIGDALTLSPLIYLKGIQSQDIESILQFIYLGEAQIYQERMDLFLDVARSLEIKGISKAVETQSLFEEREALHNQNFHHQFSANKTDEINEINLIKERQAIQNQNFDYSFSANKTDETNEMNLIEEKLAFQNQDFDNKFSVNKTDESNEINLIEDRAPFQDQDFDHTNSTNKTEKTIEIKDIKKNQKERNSYQLLSGYTTESDSNSKAVTKSDSLYPCDVCGKRFSYKASLNLHKSSIHDGIKYPCIQCNHIFANLGNLRRHTKSIHDGVKYPCNDCHLEFSQSSTLHMHVKNVHKITEI